MNSNDYVKYITQTVVKMLDQPKEERKQSRMEKKELKEPFIYRWFGLLPYFLYDQTIRRIKKKKPI